MTPEEQAAADAAAKAADLAQAEAAAAEADARAAARLQDPALDPRIKKLAGVDESLAQDYLSVRYESEKRRKDLTKAREESAAATAELAKIRSQNDEAERKKLAENNEWKALHEKEAAASANLRKKLVDAKVDSQIAKRGYTEEGEKRARRLIELKGIEIDSTTHEVAGVDRAFERMEDEWGADLFKDKGTRQSTTKEEEPPNPKEPREGESAADYKRRKQVADTGREPPPAPNRSAKQFDARKEADPDVRAARLAEILK